MRYFVFSLILGVIAVISIAGFRGQLTERRPIELFPDMDRQLKFRPQSTSTLTPTGRADRQTVAGTIPQIDTATDDYVNTGVMGSQFGDGIPVAITAETMKRGQERYQINCAVCHGASGNGNGVIGKYGLAGIANILNPPIADYSDGHLFYVITHGKGNMGGYGANITPEDRWYIVAYIRALQRSQNGSVKDLPPKPEAPQTP